VTTDFVMTSATFIAISIVSAAVTVSRT